MIMQTVPTSPALFEKYTLLHVILVFLVVTTVDYEDYINCGKLVKGADALRVQGEFDLREDFFIFLAKFGFQKTDIRGPNDTQGVIYGNITMKPNDVYGLEDSDEYKMESNHSGKCLKSIDR